MAQEIKIVDDLTGEVVPAGRKPVKFVVEGKSYSLDLTVANEKKLRTALSNLEKAQSAVAAFTARSGSRPASAAPRRAHPPGRRARPRARRVPISG